ncbi:MAG: hypothetical protein RLZ72_336 [Actinomycetota bacterium]|jgi:hypothetical protein
MLGRTITKVFGSLVIVAMLAGVNEAGDTATAGSTSYIEGTDPAAVLFDPTSVVRIDMEIPDNSWNQIQADIYSTTYRRAYLTITMNGSVVNNPYNLSDPTKWEVGIRLKGRASRRDLNGKAPFKIKIDKYVTGQNLFGLKKLTLNNMVQDPSMVREAAVYRLYRAMGVPSSRTGFVSLFVDSPSHGNDLNFGLYLNIETPDEVMLERWFGAGGTTHLYESAYDTDVTSEYYSQYLDSVDIGDPADTTDLMNAVANSNLTGSAWWNAVQDDADMDEVIALMGVDIFVSNWDGYTDFVRNNHYMHFDADGILAVMPWGNDQVYPTDTNFFFAFDGSNPDPRGWSNVRSIMYRRCVTVPACNFKLMEAVNRASRLTTSARLANMISTMYSTIHTVAENDPRKEVDNSTFAWSVDYVRSYQAARISAWNAWKVRLAPNAPTVTVTKSGTTFTLRIANANATTKPASGQKVQQYRGSSWVTVATGNSTTVRVVTSVRHPRFRVQSSNIFGASSWTTKSW